MAISDYASLQSAMTAWLHHSNYASDYPTMIQLAEAKLNRRLRLQAMQKALSLTMTAANNTTALPNDFLQLQSIWINMDPIQKLQPLSVQSGQFFAPQSAGGLVKFYARDQGNFMWFPTPDSSYSVLGSYYAAFAALSGGVNWLITNAPDLYLFASLLEVEPYTRAAANPQGLPPAQMMMYQERVEQIIQDLKDQDAANMYSGGTLVMRTDTGNP